MSQAKAPARTTRRPRTLNYDLVPEPEFTPTFMSLPSELEDSMQRFPRTLKRMKAVLTNCCGIKISQPQQAENAFRAALTEFAAIEDLLNRELPEGNLKFRLLDTDNPLPHILKQLRNLQVHLEGSSIAGHQISLWLKNVPGAEPIDMLVPTIADLTDTQLLELDAFQKGYYSQAQASEMVAWINTRQLLFGIDDVIYRGVVEAAERITAVY